MITRHPQGIRRRTMAALLGAVCLLAGCAGPQVSADTVGELRAMLSQLDRAIVDGRYGKARTLLDDLVDATVAARDSGEVEQAHAERVVAASADLLAALPHGDRRAVLRIETPEPDPEPRRDGGGDATGSSRNVRVEPPRDDEPNAARAGEVEAQPEEASDAAPGGDDVVSTEASTMGDGKRDKREEKAKKRAQKEPKAK